MFKKLLISLTITLILVVSLFFYVKPSFSRSFHQRYTETTDLHNENIKGIQLYENIHDDRFKEVFGNTLEKSGNHDNYIYYNVQEGIEIATNSKGDIIRFIVEKPDTTTIRGIKIGDSISKVKNGYGENFYQRTEQGTQIVGYVDKKYHQTIEFWCNQQKVQMIRFDDNSIR